MSVPCVRIEPDNEVDKLLYKYFTSNIRKGWIEVGEGDEKCCMPECYQKIAEKIENFEVKDSDIFITTHPKTGTTWTQEMVWMIVNNLDFEGGKTHLYIRSPFLEFEGILDHSGDEFEDLRKNSPEYLKNSIEACTNYPHTPRIIKTHMPFSLLPRQVRDKTKKPKIIHVARNAKDTCVSFYYHSRLLEGYKGNINDFCKLFIGGRACWSPFWTNVLSYWKRKDEFDILFIKYEDMKKNLGSVIRQVANYLDCSLTEDQVVILEDHLSFKKMKHNSSVNFEDFAAIGRKVNNVDGIFMRSGTVGSYKEDLTQDMIDSIDQWTKDNLKGTGLNLDD